MAAKKKHDLTRAEQSTRAAVDDPKTQVAQVSQAETTVDSEVTGETLRGKDKVVSVKVEGRSAIVSIGSQKVVMNRDTLPTLIRELQAAFIEVG